ncbi:MAG: hypothetical protein ACREBI_10130 [Nitrosotalea sp.]
MKTLHLALIVMATVSLFSTVLTVEAQCYGCGQNTSALKQALFGKQIEELNQKNEQLGKDSQIIILLIGVLIALGCVTGIATWILLKTRKIIKK